jgi:hypothetical protein
MSYLTETMPWMHPDIFYQVWIDSLKALPFDETTSEGLALVAQIKRMEDLR